MVLNKNKKGQIGFFFLLMIGITMFILAFALSSALVTSNSQARSNMDCNNESISVDQKITCGVVDIIAPWVIGLIVGLGGVAFGAKLTGY